MARKRYLKKTPLKEARELLSLQHEHRVYGAVEFHKRYDEANLKLKDYFLEGHIGDPLYVHAEMSQKKNIPEKQFQAWVTKTNVFQYLGIHYLDIIYFVTHAKPLRAMALGQKDWLFKKGIDTFDAIEAMVEWQTSHGKHFCSTLLTNWIEPEKSSAMSNQKITIVGTQGRLESDQKKRGLMMVTDKGGVGEPNPYFSMPYGKEGRVTYSGYGMRSIEQFLTDAKNISMGLVTVDEIENDRPSFKEALVSTAILEGIHESLTSNGKWVSISHDFYEKNII